jgi:hypothetical protein
MLITVIKKFHSFHLCDVFASDSLGGKRVVYIARLAHVTITPNSSLLTPNFKAAAFATAL